VATLTQRLGGYHSLPAGLLTRDFFALTRCGAWRCLQQNIIRFQRASEFRLLTNPQPDAAGEGSPCRQEEELHGLLGMAHGYASCPHLTPGMGRKKNGTPCVNNMVGLHGWVRSRASLLLYVVDLPAVRISSLHTTGVANDVTQYRHNERRYSRCSSDSSRARINRTLMVCAITVALALTRHHESHSAACVMVTPGTGTPEHHALY